MLMRSQPSVGNCNALKSYAMSFIHEVSKAGGGVKEGSEFIGGGRVKRVIRRRAGVEIEGRCGDRGQDTRGRKTSEEGGKRVKREENR